MLSGIFRREKTLDELKERARKATVSAKFIIEPALWAVSTVFFIVMPYSVWWTTKDLSFTFFCTGTYIAMIFAVWAGKKFISVTFLRWYAGWHKLNLNKELYNKLYAIYSQKKYGYTKKQVIQYTEEAMQCDITPILEFIEEQERRK